MKKTISVLLFIFSCFGFFNISELKAQTANTDADVIVLRVYEEIMKSSQIIISHGDGKIETIELEPISRRNRGPNADKINSAIRKILGMGYELISTAGSGENEITLTYIFQKKKK